MKKVISYTINISLAAVIFVGCGDATRAGDAACDAAKVNFVNNVALTSDNIEAYKGLEHFITEGFIEPILAKEDACITTVDRYGIDKPCQGVLCIANGPAGSEKREKLCRSFQRTREIQDAGFQMAAKVAMFCFE